MTIEEKQKIIEERIAPRLNKIVNDPEWQERIANLYGGENFSLFQKKIENKPYHEQIVLIQMEIDASTEKLDYYAKNNYSVYGNEVEIEAFRNLLIKQKARVESFRQSTNEKDKSVERLRHFHKKTEMLTKQAYDRKTNIDNEHVEKIDYEGLLMDFVNYDKWKEFKDERTKPHKSGKLNIFKYDTRKAFIRRFCKCLKETDTPKTDKRSNTGRGNTGPALEIARLLHELLVFKGAELKVKTIKNEINRYLK